MVQPALVNLGLIVLSVDCHRRMQPSVRLLGTLSPHSLMSTAFQLLLRQLGFAVAVLGRTLRRSTLIIELAVLADEINSERQSLHIWVGSSQSPSSFCLVLEVVQPLRQVLCAGPNCGTTAIIYTSQCMCDSDPAAGC